MSSDPESGEPGSGMGDPGSGGRRGLLFVISAPSGTGKTTVAERVVQVVPDLSLSRSYTSRPARAGEVHSSVADISRAQRELGYTPGWSLGQGLSAMWKELVAP